MAWLISIAKRKLEYPAGVRMLKIHQAADLSTSHDMGKSLLVENSVTRRQPAAALWTRNRIQRREDQFNSQRENLTHPSLCLQNFIFLPSSCLFHKGWNVCGKHIMCTCCQEHCFIKTFALPLVLKGFSVSPGSAGLQYENDNPFFAFHLISPSEKYHETILS